MKLYLLTLGNNVAKICDNLLKIVSYSLSVSLVSALMNFPDECPDTLNSKICHGYDPV